MKLPISIFMILVHIPFVGAPLRGSPDEIESTETSVRIPVVWFANVVFRSVLCFAVIGIGGYLLLLWFQPEQEISIKTADLTDAIHQSDEKFREVVAICDREKLSSWLKQLSDNPQDSYSDRRQALKNRAIAANKVGSSRMGSFRLFGVSEELKLRSRLAMFDMKNNQFDAEQNQQLNKLSKLYMGVEFPETNRQTDDLKTLAQIGDFMSSFIKIIETQSPESTNPNAQELLSKIEQFAQDSLLPKALEVALNGISQASRVRLKQLNKPANVCDDLDLLLVEINKSNVARVINEFSAIDCSSESAMQLDYLDNGDPQFKDRFVIEFRNKLDRILQCDDVGEKEYSMMLSKLSDLAQSGWTRASKKLLKKAADSFRQSGQYPLLETQVSQLQARLGLVGQPLQLEDVKGATNQQPQLGQGLVDATIVIYLTVMDNARESDVKFRQMISVYNSLTSSGKRIRFCAILLHQDQQQATIEKAKELTEQAKPIQFWHLETGSAGGKRILSAVPLENQPCVLVLDRSNRVAAVNPLPQHIIGIVKKLKSAGR